MRVAIFNGPDRPISIESVPEPRPGNGDLVVKIHRCGICGSDVSMTAPGPVTYPLGPMGHEYAGEIIEVGRGIDDVKIGDRVACRPNVGCGRCDGCREGNSVFCDSVQNLNVGYAEYAAIPREAVVILPRALSLADGALIEPMACGLHAMRLAQIRRGARVLVLGAGAMALSAIYWARTLGRGRIQVVSRSAHRNDIALAIGAEAVHSFESANPETVAEALGGAPDIVAECTGSVGMVGRAIDYVRSQGTVVCMGMCSHSEALVPARCSYKEVRMIFPLGYSGAEFAETAKVFDQAQFHPEIMVSHVIALDDLPQTLEHLRGGMKSLKVQVDLTRSSANA